LEQNTETTDNTYYSLPTLLFLLYATGGLLYSLASAGVFTIMVALSRLITPLRAWAGTVFIVLMLTGCAFALLMTVSMMLRRELIPAIPTRKIWMAYIVKLSQSIARRVGLDADKAVRSFIRLSNDFVINELKNKKIARVLILLPHCIQLNSCSFKITSDINNCRKCGKCVVMNFIELAARYKFDVFVSTGGTMARKVVYERRPHLIMAVACERDLLSGIKDTLKMPVIGILNERPNGPCYNTTVDPKAVEDMLGRVFLA
jgi:hypothetical protein